MFNHILKEYLIFKDEDDVMCYKLLFNHILKEYLIFKDEYDVMCYYLIFHVPNIFIALCKKSSCFVKLQDGRFDHNARGIPAQDFTFNVFINFLI